MSEAKTLAQLSESTGKAAHLYEEFIKRLQHRIEMTKEPELKEFYRTAGDYVISHKDNHLAG